MGKVEVDGEELESKKEMLKVIGRRILASYHEPITLRQHEDFKKEHGEIAVELDALDPDILEEMIEESMMEYYDEDQGEHIEEQQEEDREWLREQVDEIDLPDF